MTAARAGRRAFLRVLTGNAAPAVAGHCLAHRGVACQSCRDACTPAAIAFPPVRGVPVPVIDALRCTRCGDCVAVCPVGALRLEAAASA